MVTESDGRTWVTREPAICYFHAKQWFNVIGMLREDGIYYYCNISSPFALDDEAIKYIDYDLDVKVFPDMTYHILDEDEYADHKKAMNLVYIAVIWRKDLDLSLMQNWSIIVLLFLTIAIFTAAGFQYKKSQLFLHVCILLSSVLVANTYQKYVLSESSGIKNVTKSCR